MEVQMIETPHTPIFSCTFGSRLYGVTTPDSDYDYKTVYVVDRMGDYLRHRGTFGTFTDVGVENNVKAETESFYIQEFANLLGQMQTICMTMLWAPKEYWKISSPAWEDLVVNRDRVVAKSVMPYIGYARSQAVKYTLKAHRMTVLQGFYDLIRTLPQKTKISDEEWFLVTTWAKQAQDDHKDCKDVTRLWTSPTGEPMVEVCGKSFSRFTHVEKWVGPVKNLLDNYGNRAKDAQDDKADLKACYHAVRIVKEAKELLSEGTITYPRPEASLLLDIRGGKYSFDELKDIIDVEIDELYKIRDASTLQDNPDREWIKEWAIRWQKNHW
jgi:predicted nucleotidyltransferase